MMKSIFFGIIFSFVSIFGFVTNVNAQAENYLFDAQEALGTINEYNSYLSADASEARAYIGNENYASAQESIDNMSRNLNIIDGQLGYISSLSTSTDVQNDPSISQQIQAILETAGSIRQNAQPKVDVAQNELETAIVNSDVSGVDAGGDSGGGSSGGSGNAQDEEGAPGDSGANDNVNPDGSGDPLRVEVNKVIQDGLVPCGNRGYKKCTICDLFVGFHNTITWLRNLVFITALVIIAIAGVMYIVSGGNQSMTQQAKGALWAALLGALAVFAAWVIITFIFLNLTDKDNSSIYRNGAGAWSFRCDILGTPVGTGTSQATEQNEGQGSNE